MLCSNASRPLPATATTAGTLFEGLDTSEETAPLTPACAEAHGVAKVVKVFALAGTGQMSKSTIPIDQGTTCVLSLPDLPG